jgi:nicotinate-nucleotide adenylyltransferase
LTKGVGILGGTFDPIHYGHLRMADDVGTALGLEEVRLIPAGNPYHRPTAEEPAPRLQRLAMAELAVRDFPRLSVDSREATTDAPRCESLVGQARTDCINKAPPEGTTAPPRDPSR